MEKSGVEITQNDIPKVAKNLITISKKIMNVNSRLLQSHVRTEHLTGGTTETALGVRSGKLRASLKAIPAKETEDGHVEAGISIGPSVYARIHIGPMGQQTTITPKRAKYLTIPLSAARAGRGGQGPGRGSALGGPWGETFVRKTGRGNLIIFGKMKVTKGARAGQLRSKIVPLFLLRKSVTVEARVYPEEQVLWIMPKVIEDFKKIGATKLGA